MAESKFEKISRLSQRLPARLDPASWQAGEWLLKQTAKLKNKLITTRDIFLDRQDDFTTNINISSIGSLFHFYYDPKWKDKLPYYDAFPLSFVIEIYNDGFLGINMHYLRPYNRVQLMSALYDIALSDQSQKQKLQVSYNILKSASKFKLFKPCLKRYLTTHVRSQYLLIEPDEWDVVLMLPTQRFIKASEDQVWADSRRKAD